MTRKYLLIAAFFTLVGAVLHAPANAEQATSLRIATMAPEGSPWMRVFHAWDTELRQRTNGRVGFTFTTSARREADFLTQIRAGTLDGAVLTSAGLGEVAPSALVLTAPGLIRDYETLDRTKAALATELAAPFRAGGYELLGFSDVGKTRLFSTERIERPSDLRARRAWAIQGDQVFGELLRAAGATPRPLELAQVLPGLTGGTIDTVPGSALAAVSMQWYPRLRFYSAENSSIILGATVLKKSVFDRLSPDDQRALSETASRAHQLLSRNLRREDERALAVVARRLQSVSTASHQAEWDRLYTDTQNRLAGRVYPRALLDRIRRGH